MITLTDISLRYGSRTLLSKASASFAPGTLTALLGRNGAGKSTLLRAVGGLSDDYGGRIELCHRDRRTLSEADSARIVSFVTTERVRIANLTSQDLVSLGRAPYTNWIGRMQRQDKEVVMQALETVGMASFARKTLDRMSDGECQKVMIARALAQQTPVILLDEPTAFLDVANRYELCALLRHLALDEGKTILFSTHELTAASEFCDTAAIIDTPALKLFDPRSSDFSSATESIFGIKHTLSK